MDRKKLKLALTMIVVMVFTIILPIGRKVEAKEDPAMGTASPEIENMIALGKTLIGHTKYEMGTPNDGHSNWSEAKVNDKPTGLDCSSFTAWVFYKSMGVDYGFAPSTRDWGGLLEEVPQSEVQRGDFLNGNGHIEIYLGQDSDGNDISLHMQNPRADVGITLTNWNGNWKSKYKVLRPSVESAVSNGATVDEDAIIQSGAKGVSQQGGSDGGTTVTNGNFEYNPEDDFMWLDPRVNFTGDSDSHSKSTSEGKKVGGSGKGLKGNSGSIFDIFF